MLTLDVYNESGKVIGTVKFDESVLGEKVRPRLMHQAVMVYLANRRAGTHSTKTKGERKGSGAKPYRQKGTGHARHGMRRSPLWRKGGVTFGPRPRDHRRGLSRAMRREALKSALLGKFLDKEVTVIEPLAMDEPKTKRVSALLRALGTDGKRCLVALEAPDANLWKSARNIPRLDVTTAREMNAFTVLRAARLILTKPAIEKLPEAVSR